jgi:perosamine synthetase
VFAFYPNKQMTTGEGGAVTTGSADEHELLVSLRNQGRLETASWLQHGRLGFNYRLDDLSAALGIGQLEKLDRILAGRWEVAARYGELLEGLDLELPLPDDPDHERSWFVYVVKLPRGADRDGVIGRLAADGIACAPYLPSIHLQTYMRERFGFAEGMCPVSEDASARTMAIPFHARLAREDQERVAESLAAALAAA